tara:strand:+ start:556 stop:927 length:372 start_codon:yes stop_codon:yes gene_type:complete
MKYFENFPTIEYEGQKVKDITRRNSFTSFVTSNPMLYLPYTVKEGYKPEDVANAYYGSTDYTWLVCMSNNIIDPYHQWPLAEADFNAYLVEKYGEVSGRIGDEVVEWTKEDNGDNIIYYYREV